LEVVTYFLEVLFQSIGVFAPDKVLQDGKLVANALNLGEGAWVAEDFGEKVVVFGEEAASDVHVSFEGGAGSILVFHGGGEDDGGGEGDAEGVGDDVVVFFEGEVTDVKMESGIELSEKTLSLLVAFGDDDGVFGGEVAEVGEGGAEHGVCGGEGEAGVGVKVPEAGLDGGDVGEDGGMWEEGDDLAEGVEGVVECDAVDDDMRVKAGDFERLLKAQGVVEEAKALGVIFEDGDFVVETEEVGEESAHFAGTEDKYLHGWG
jgi:hypothetical protein